MPVVPAGRPDDAGLVADCGLSASRVDGDDDARHVQPSELDDGHTVVIDPLALPHAAGGRLALLLVEGGPDSFADAAAGAGVVLGVEAFGPQGLADLAAEGARPSAMSIHAWLIRDGAGAASRAGR